MKDFFKNKKNLIICGVVLVVIILIVILIINSSNQEKKLEKYLKQLGKVYYEDVYYGAWGDDSDGRTELLSRFTTIGIKTDLDNLVRAVSGRNDLGTDEEILAKFVNKETGTACNRASTKVVFYPHDPYGKTDYKMEVIIDCGFDKK